MIEIVTFRLRHGVDPEHFKALDEQLQTEFFYHQRGLGRRTTARGADGSYVCILHWGGAGDADAAIAETEGENKVTSRLTELIDESTIKRQRYETL